MAVIVSWIFVSLVLLFPKTMAFAPRTPHHGIEIRPLLRSSSRITARQGLSQEEIDILSNSGDVADHQGSNDEQANPNHYDASVSTNNPNQAITLVEEENDEIRTRFGSAAFVLTQAALIGVGSGWCVGIFKLAIDAVRQFSYGSVHSSSPQLLLIPALGGVVVGILSLYGSFPPGLRGTVKGVDDSARKPRLPGFQFFAVGTKALQFVRKALAAIITLGTGNSLGPEGPAVEIGMAVSQLCMKVFPEESSPGESSDPNSRGSMLRRIKRNRLLLSCGAAAGVSAGFNAPIAGVFFALEIVQGAFVLLAKSARGADRIDPEHFTTSSGTISAILLSSVLSALACRSLLGDHLVLELSDYTLNEPLAELPFYLLLGATSGVVAALFSQTAKIAKNMFDGEIGPTPIRQAFSSLPKAVKPVIGGLSSGFIGLFFPQILFFGYETLNGLLANDSLPTSLLLTLLFVKILSTALAAGSGLVGGTFAPSLFLGAMTGASFHNIANWGLSQSMTSPLVTSILGNRVLELADVPAYAMVGAACTLAALFRAPLTASLLLFELTRDYDVILPLMASAGVASLVGDLIEQEIERERVDKDRRDVDPVSWGDLASAPEETPVIHSE